MSAPSAPVKRPGRGWYAVAAVLAALAAAILVVLAIWIGRAVAGYSITPFETNTTVTVGDRGVAIWVSPQNRLTPCLSYNLDTAQQSISDGTASKVTVTDGGHTWRRVGIVEGPPGSKHAVTCGDGGTEQFGYADNPRIGRYVVGGVAGGLVAGLAAIGAFVIVPIVAVKRHRKPTTA